MPFMEVQNVSKRYSNGDGIEGLSFSIEAGEVVALLGPNGAREDDNHSMFNRSLST